MTNDEAHTVEPEGDPQSPEAEDQAPKPDIDGSALLSGPIREGDLPQISPGEEFGKAGRGTGRIFAGGDVEQAQGDQLSRQMLRSALQQLQIASEHIRNIRWIETDGSRHVEDDNKLVVYEFELTLSNGRSIFLTGPVINVEFR